MAFVFAQSPPLETPLRAAIGDWYRFDESEAVARILAAAKIPAVASATARAASTRC
jgi:hypothetical protein